MNWRYGIHPNNYAIGETEKYYSDMSEKGSCPCTIAWRINSPSLIKTV